MGRVTRLVDRNGEIVPFRRSRIVRAILAAVRSAGSSDEWVADKLADMVVYFIDQQHGERPQPPTADEVDDMIERALLSAPDLTAISQAFLASRRQQRDLRSLEESLSSADESGPQVAQSRDAIEGWNRARITAALVRENGLDADRAGDVARAVEQRVVSLKLPRMTTGLIRELVDLELISRGITTEPGTLHVPRYDLEQWMFGPEEDEPAASQLELTARAGRRVLSEYALASLLDPASRELHLRGGVHFCGLDAPAAVDLVRLDAVACLAPGAGFGMQRRYGAQVSDIAGGFARLATLVGDAAALSAGPVVLRGLDAALAADEFDRGRVVDGLRLIAAQSPRGLVLELGPPLQPARDLVTRALIDTLADDAALRRGVSLELALSPAAFAEPARRALVERACAVAAWCGEPAFRLHEPGRPAPAGLFLEHTTARHEAVLARAALNLVAPALASRELSGYMAALDGAVSQVAAGLARRVQFLQRVAMRRMGEPAPDVARMLRALVGATREVALVPLGLATAAELLTGAGADSEPARRVAQQVLSFVSFKFSDAAARAGLTGGLATHAAGAAQRMARLDLARLRASDPESPLRLRLAAEDAWAGGAAMPAPLPVRERLPHEAALHSLLGREAEVTVSPDEALTGADLAALLRACLAEGAARPARLSLSVRHRLCRDCGARSVATLEACPACGSTSWAVATGQKSLFG